MKINNANQKTLIIEVQKKSVSFFKSKIKTCSVGQEHSMVTMKMAWDLDECSFMLVAPTVLII
jgi:hypothetical protein